VNLVPSDKKNQLNHPVENFGLTELFLDSIFPCAIAPKSPDTANIIRYDINLTLGCSRFYDFAPITVFDSFSHPFLTVSMFVYFE